MLDITTPEGTYTTADAYLSAAIASGAAGQLVRWLAGGLPILGAKSEPSEECRSALAPSLDPCHGEVCQPGQIGTPETTPSHNSIPQVSGYGHRIQHSLTAGTDCNRDDLRLVHGADVRPAEPPK